MDETQRSALLLVAKATQFAAHHPFMATAIFGAAVGAAAGSTLTYKALTVQPPGPTVIASEVYELALAVEDLQRLQDDPTATIRWELPKTTIIVTSEPRKRIEQSVIDDE